MAATVMTVRKRAALAFSSAVLGLSFLGAGVAQAEPGPSTTSEQPAAETRDEAGAMLPAYGIVDTRHNVGLKIRKHPTTHSRQVGSLREGAKVWLRCYTRSQPVKHNRVWYKLRDRQGWVSAAYVKRYGRVPVCHGR